MDILLRYCSPPPDPKAIVGRDAASGIWERDLHQIPRARFRALRDGAGEPIRMEKVHLYTKTVAGKISNVYNKGIDTLSDSETRELIGHEDNSVGIALENPTRASTPSSSGRFK